MKKQYNQWVFLWEMVERRIKENSTRALMQLELVIEFVEENEHEKNIKENSLIIVMD